MNTIERFVATIIISLVLTCIAYLFDLRGSFTVTFGGRAVTKASTPTAVEPFLRNEPAASSVSAILRALP